MTLARGKVDAQLGWVLHTYPVRETSLIVEAFTRDFGRVSLMARGARRPRSAIRGLLMSFQPLELSWVGKSEVLTLTKAEWQGGQPLLSGEALFCGFYLNELLVRLLPREDAHPRLFEHYGEMLQRLGNRPQGKINEADLRCFEKWLLQELGYGLTLSHDCQGMPIMPEAIYQYAVETGPIKCDSRYSNFQDAISGRTLLDLENEDFSSLQTRLEAKQLMRRMFAHYLSGKDLETRKIFRELQTFYNQSKNEG